MDFEFRRGWGWLLLAALTLSTIGDEITLITLMFRAAGYDAAYAVPALLIAQLVPGLLAAPYIGQLTDRRDAGRLLILASCAQALVVALMVIFQGLFATIVGATLLGLFFAVSGTATFALIPVLAERLGMTLARANAGLELVRSAGMLAGPVIGGLIVAWGGTDFALWIDAASFLLLGAILWASGLRRRVAPRDAKVRGARGLLADYLPLLRNRRITVMSGALTLEVLATAIADVAFVFLVTVALKSGPTALGVLIACWAGGMLVGSAAGDQLAQRHAAAIAFATATMMGLTMLAIGLMPAFGHASLLAVGVAFMIGGAANSIHNIAVRTMLQTEAPADSHGKIAAIYVTATRSATIAGYLIGGLFVPDAAFDAYRIAGWMGVAAGLIGWMLFSFNAKRTAA